MTGHPNPEAREKRSSPQPPKDVPPTKKRKRYQEKPHKVTRRDERREIMNHAKATWEQLRPKAVSKEKSVKLVNDLLDLLRGRIVEFVFRHDGSRIVQWMLGAGDDKQKKSVMAELMEGSEHTVAEGEPSFFVRLACDRYGHHLAFKMLRVADKHSKMQIFEKYLRGNAAELIRSSHGADVLDFAYQTVLGSRSRAELVIELLYTRERKLLHTIRGKLFASEALMTQGAPARHAFAESLDLVGETFRDVVVESAAVSLGQLVDKESLLRFEVLHAAIKEYLHVVVTSFPKEKAVDLAVLLAPLLVHFAHTKPGVFVAVNCVKMLDAKHRKKVVRGLKTHIRKLLEDEYGHRLILALFEWVDDTRLVGNTVSAEIFFDSSLDAELNDVDEAQKPRSRGGRSKAEKKGKCEKIQPEKESIGAIDTTYVKQMCLHKYARMPVLSLFVGRNTRYFNPDIYGLVWADIDSDKFGKTSKKDSDVRRRELRALFESAISAVMRTEMTALLQSHWSAAMVLGALQVDETRDGVVAGLTSCLRREEGFHEVVGNTCGRKTVGTMFKVGGKETASRVLDACGAEVVGRFAALKECMPIAEHLVNASDRADARKAMERASQR